MDLAFFLYNVALMGIAFVTCSISIVVWLMTTRKDCLVAAVGFIAYALDLSLIFFDEYSRTKYPYDITFDLPLTHPFLSWLLGLLVLSCLWVWVLMRTRTKVTFRLVASYLVPIGIVMLLFLPYGDVSGQIRQYLYWMTRDVGIVICLAWAVIRYRHVESRAIRLDMLRSRRFFLFASVLTVCILIEDTLMILFVRPPEGMFAAQLFWHWQERNFSENFLMVGAAIQLSCRYREIFSVFSKHPRYDADLERNSQGIVVGTGDIASKVELFADSRGLSPREIEVLGLLVRGLDIQQIASELVISDGTVKAHLHRIYAKSKVNTREALLDSFWKQ